MASPPTASEKAMEIINAAMKNGFILRRDNKFLIVGPGGSGKSTLMARLLGLLVDGIRRSTNLATHPVRTISVSRISRKGRVWEVVDLDRLSDMVADASLNPIVMEAVVVDDTTTTHYSVAPEAKVSLKPKFVPTAPLKIRDTLKIRNTPSSSRMELVEPTSAPPSFQEEMGRRVDRSQGYQNVMVTDWIQLIDSGGQPQFHELASIFVKNLSGYISVFKLSEPLSHHGEVQFFINSKPINTPYESTYSNEGTIRCTMRAVQSQACKHKGRITKLAFVATHRDEDCSAEPLDVKNAKLHRILVEILPKNLREGVISRGGSLKQAIFPFNGKNPDETDKAVLEELRTTLMNNPTGEKRKLPLKYHGLEIALLKLMQRLDRQVLSREECLQIAIDIQFDEDSFEVALQFLSDLNIIYYNREVLPEVVFGSSQVILDKLSEIVISSLRLRENHCRGLDGKWRRLNSLVMYFFYLVILGACVDCFKYYFFFHADFVTRV